MVLKKNILFIIIFAIAVAMLFLSCEDDVKQLELSIGQEVITASFSEEVSYDVEIVTNGEWEAYPYNSWCTVSSESGSGNGKITVYLQRNDTKEIRTTSVEVNSKLGNDKKTIIIDVAQLPCEPTLKVDLTEVSIGNEAEEIAMVVTTNLPSWGVSLPKWCEAVSKLSYKTLDPALKEITVKFKAKDNTSRNVRTGSVGISGAGCPTVLVALMQKPSEYVYVEAAGGQATQTFSGEWTAKANVNWFTVPESGSGNITINATANEDKMPRRGIITVTSDGNTQKFIIAQKPKLTPNRSQTWTDVNGIEHTSIPADKEFWETGDVLVYNKATKGDGVNIVLFNDAFNKMEMAVGGVYETSAKESVELFFALPVLRDYREHFNVYIHMRVWEKSGLYNQYPNGTFRALWDQQQHRFLPYIIAMPQLQGIPGDKVVGYYYAHGMAGGFMSSFSGYGMTYSSYTFGAEPNYPYWTYHEFMGHALSLLGDMYQAPPDYSEWSFYPKSYLPVEPVMDDPIENQWASNCYVAEWNQEAWDAFIALPGNSQYAGNLNQYRMEIPSNYKEIHPTYEGGDYIWHIDYNGDFMNAHVLGSTGWDRYLVYRRLMRLGNLPYSLVDFFKNDQQYANVTDWYGLLGLHGWAHSYQYDPHQSGGSPFSPWDE